ncbi:hypothetical protein K469DRAFT_810664, partial [Zopfia rhizophila CBS 207.26]
TEKEKSRWSADPLNYTGTKLRYVILNPGQTTYFEPGTIHFVFRHPMHQTVMLGGHVLRWSRVDSWMKTVLSQLRFPNTTNEDVLPTAAVYVETVAKLVLDREQQGSVEELGGKTAIENFFRLKKVILLLTMSYQLRY